MSHARALLDLEVAFVGALYDREQAGPVDAVVGAGLTGAERLGIYRHASEQIHGEALRTTYPAVLALVGEEFFEQTTRQYRHAHPSASGNLQAFGADFGAFLASLPSTRELPWLGDVARLEWLRQEAALASDAEVLSARDFSRALERQDVAIPARLHPSVRLLDSPHPVLMIRDYALNPRPERLQLPAHGDRVLVWRSGSEVAMAELEIASYRFCEALAQGRTLQAAHALAQAADADFDLPVCVGSLLEQALLVVSGTDDDQGEESCSSD